MRKDYLYIAIVALIIFNVYTINKVNNIGNSVDRNMQQIQREQTDIRNEISNIYNPSAWRAETK